MRSPSLSEILSEHGTGFPARKKIYETLEEPEHLGAPVLLYFANFGHPSCTINKEDIAPMESLLGEIFKKARGGGKKDKLPKLILLMHSPGGLIDVAEEILYLIRSYCKRLEIVALYSLKSAATLLAFGTDHLYMGHLSELGPVDPQVFTPRGFISSQSYLDFYTTMKRRSSEGELTRADIALLHNLDPGFLDQMLKAIERTIRFSRQELANHLMRGKKSEAIENAINQLRDPNISLSHGKTVGSTTCVKLFGRENVTVLGRNNPTWCELWELFMRADTHVRSSLHIKIYESAHDSLALGTGKKPLP